MNVKLPSLNKENTGMAKDGTVSVGTLGFLYGIYKLDEHLEELIEVLKANTESAEALLKFITQ